MTEAEKQDRESYEQETRRNTGWIQTYTGRQVWPLRPSVDQIEIDDIVHALSMLCRYTGHTRRFYSVAQHSVLASYAVPPQDAKWALMHDATEAYLCDVARPVKPFLGDYKGIERRLMDVICDKLGLPREEPASVKLVDLRLLATERRDLMAPPPVPWLSTENIEPLPKTIDPLDPESARELFSARFNELFNTSPSPASGPEQAGTPHQPIPGDPGVTMWKLRGYTGPVVRIVFDGVPVAAMVGGRICPDEIHWHIEDSEPITDALPDRVVAKIKAFRAAKSPRSEPGGEKLLNWRYASDEDWWYAASASHDDGGHFEYQIAVDDDGYFVYDRSSQELGMPFGRQPTLIEAQAACEANEQTIVANAKARGDLVPADPATPPQAEKSAKWPVGTHVTFTGNRYGIGVVTESEDDLGWPFVEWPSGPKSRSNPSGLTVAPAPTSAPSGERVAYSAETWPQELVWLRDTSGVCDIPYWLPRGRHLVTAVDRDGVTVNGMFVSYERLAKSPRYELSRDGLAWSACATTATAEGAE